MKKYDFKVGDKLYLYTARNGKFHLHEGEVVERKYTYGRRMVKFDDGHQRDSVPSEFEIGRIQSGGPRLWLTERDDNKARRLFLEYEEGKLLELEKLIVKKRELIKVLEEGLK